MKDEDIENLITTLKHRQEEEAAELSYRTHALLGRTVYALRHLLNERQSGKACISQSRIEEDASPMRSEQHGGDDHDTD